MSLNTAGYLLEGFRVATANSPFTFPPRTLVSNQGALDASPSRAEYAVFVSGQSAAAAGIEIADPALTFLWTRNNSTISRFDWDGFAKRWATSPGGGQEAVGKVANSPRVAVPIPDQKVSATEAPYALYVGSPDRVVTFNVAIVGSSADFTNPPPGTVQVSADKGEVNFGSVDLANQVLAGQTLYLSRQSFFDRTKVKGRVGSLPDSSSASYGLWLNPVPGVGQTPRVRIGFRAPLTAVAVATEAGLSPAPTPGTFKFSLDTGRLAFAPADIDAFAGMPVYYDGVMLGSFQLARGTLGLPASSWPASVGSIPGASGTADSSRYVVFTEPPGAPRYYFVVQLVDAGSVGASPSDGVAYLDPSTGAVYVSGSDPGVQTGVPVQYVDTVRELERGVSVQFYRSGVNGPGEESAPDFVDTYTVPSQTVADGIGSSPFVMLPTVPTVDSFIEYRVDQGTSGGTFVGTLVDANDPTKPGFGYILDLEAKQLKFSSRKTVTSVLDKATSAIKLDDAAINPFGFQVTRDGQSIRPGVDFDFNQDAGLLEFIEPVGENDPANSIGITGTIVPPNRFEAAPGSFPNASQEKKFLFVKSGPNFGVYPILASVGSTTLFISGTFAAAGSASADIRASDEVIADRFWTQFLPPFKKLKVYRATSTSGPFGQLGTSDFTVLASTGQINLATAAKPGEVIKVEYTSLDSEDEGVTVTPTSRTEFAGFRVRQETGSVVPNSGIIKFNPDGKTVLTDYAITVYVDGITVPDGGFTFSAPGTLTISALLTETSLVTINYYVAEALGGETNFNLLNTPVDVDFPLVTADQATTVYNGDQTGTVSAGSAVLIDGKEVVLVGSSTYDSAADATTVVFDPPPEVDSSGASLQSCGPVTGEYMVLESRPVDVLTKGTNTLSVLGNAPYPAGTIVTVSGDPYYVVSSSYVAAVNRTNVVLAANAHRNYVIPEVRRTVRPVFNPGSEFKTQKPAHAGYPMTLVRTGNVSKVMKPGVDYDSGEGGVIKTTSDLSFGDVVTAFYVARKEQPVGTRFTFNYAAQIAPNQTNGIRGQKLIAKYHLSNPDAFFFRVESVQTFIPEVVKELASSSGGSSGPSTSSVSSLQTKDYGSPSLYFDEQHLRNLDVVVARLLQFYNDQANYYEDVLANFDGRVVGGSSGRFRFNGDVSGVKRSSYAEVQNDIDDQVKLYDGVVLVSFSPITFSDGPVYGPIWDYNALSRFYGTARQSVPVPFNDKVTPILDFGKTIGSIGISNLQSVGMFRTARARSKYTVADSSMRALVLPGPNGDPNTLVPPFFAGQKVLAFSASGSQTVSAEVTDVSGIPVVVTLDTAVPDLSGGLMADTSDPNFTDVHYYREGDHVSVDYDNGQVHNAQLPPPFGPTDLMAGNEVMEVDVTFLNRDTTPKRIPALDGLELTDGGTPSFPPLTYKNEIGVLTREIAADSLVGTGTVAALTVVTSFLPVQAGQTVMFLTGPNAGQQRTVAIPSVGSFTVTTPFPALSVTPQDIVGFSFVGDVGSITAEELELLSGNAASPPSGSDQIGVLDSELTAIGKAVLSFGPILVQRFTGSVVSSDILNDPGASFLTTSPPVSGSCFLYIPSGPNHGLYKVKEAGSTSIVVDTASPYQAFPQAGTSGEVYYVIQPWSFVTAKQPAFAAEFIRRTLAWQASTEQWASFVNAAGAQARVSAVNARLADIASFTSRIQALLKKDEKIYDVRYMWIQQRIDRKDGLVVKISQAAAQRQEALNKLLQDQQKRLIASQLA